MNCSTCDRQYTIMECKYCEECKAYFCPHHDVHPHKPHIFVIEGYHTLIDWAEYRPEKVLEADIWGFELHYRGEWFVEVVPKKGGKYTIGHGTHRLGVSQLLANPHAIILRIVNEKRIEDFLSELQKVMPEAKKLNAG